MRVASKDIAPYRMKLPPPDFTNHANKALPPIYGSGRNTALLPRFSDFNVNDIKKDPKQFKQQMLEKRNSLKLLSQRQHLSAPTISNMNDQHSDFHLTKDINTLT